MCQHFAATYNAGELGCIRMTCNCKPAYMQLFLDGLLVDIFTFTHDAGLLHRHFLEAECKIFESALEETRGYQGGYLRQSSAG
jgi:hypothetical protein